MQQCQRPTRNTAGLAPSKRCDQTWPAAGRSDEEQTTKIAERDSDCAAECFDNGTINRRMAINGQELCGLKATGRKQGQNDNERQAFRIAKVEE